jgi:hypothetical protein
MLNKVNPIATINGDHVNDSWKEKANEADGEFDNDLVGDIHSRITIGWKMEDSIDREKEKYGRPHNHSPMKEIQVRETTTSMQYEDRHCS